MNSTTSADVMRLVTHALTNDDGLAAEVAGRVTDQHPDLVRVTEVQYPSVTVEMVGGNLTPTPVYQRDQFEVWCYSRVSKGQARKVYDLVVAALQQERLQVANVASVAVCVETRRPTDTYDDKSRTWACYGRWLARAIG